MVKNIQVCYRAKSLIVQDEYCGDIIMVQVLSDYNPLAVRRPQKVRFRLATKTAVIDANINGDRIFIGRAESGTQVDVDLSPHNAHQLGVSRCHAVLMTREGEVYIMDSGSRNGTRVNGKTLTPMEPHVLHDGDLVYFGRFPVTVSIIYKSVLTKLGTQEVKAIPSISAPIVPMPQKRHRRHSTKMLTETQTAKKLETIEMKGMLNYLSK